MLHQEIQREAFATLSRCRAELCASMTGRADALFELTDALLCTDGPVRTLVDLARLRLNTAVTTALCTAG
ncbi:uncharacterized protein SAZU_2253 [Streptomyces azureus]|uniref:Uncharacterized protein n=1 Tax=Streptomyces azureus TaxID=146537 RepID=A0A0K8PI13_STRAJ|nr:uncharacterized protein SAZU_2253 [Streptomyces azureus]